MSLLPDEGNQEQPTGGTESPTSSPSGSQQGQPLPDVSALIKRLDEQDKLLRGLQKGTDKQIAQVNSNVKRILELKEQGLNEDQIKRELWIDQQMQGQTPTPQAPAGSESARQAPNVESFTAADAIAEVESYELQVNDPSFIALLRQNPNRQQVKDYILERKKPQPTASAAGITQAAATSGARSVNVDALEAELVQLYKQPSKYAARIQEIGEQLKKAG